MKQNKTNISLFLCHTVTIPCDADEFVNLSNQVKKNK